VNLTDEDQPALVNLPEAVRDRDVIHDTNGRVYVTLGYIQPKDRILSFLKYIPHPEGRWQAHGQRYKRIFWGGGASATEGMKRAQEDYLINDSHFGTKLLEVARSDVQKYFSPEIRVKEILESESRDSLEASVALMTQTLHDTLGIPLERLGVTGSVVWKAHNPSFSDINMNIYGFENAWHLQREYETVAKENVHMRLREMHEWKRTMSRVVERIPVLPLEDMKILFTRRMGLLCNERSIGVMPILLPEEAPITHGSESYDTITPSSVRVKMEITSDIYGLFIPALYESISEPLDIIEGERISRVMVYEGSFRGLIRHGDTVEASGIIQKVTPSDSNDGIFYQMMVGSKVGSGKEFIRLVRED
jgi:predicted nucleotidyltransferase